jgi:hypothetical protein
MCASLCAKVLQPMTSDVDLDQVLAGLPTAVEAYYTQANANSPVFLCRVPLAGKRRARAGEPRGEVRLDWLPRPRVVADMEGEVNPLTVLSFSTEAPEPDLATDHVPEPPRGHRRRGPSSARWQHSYFDVQVGDPQASLERGLLHLVNWPALHGATVRHPLGVGFGRVQLASDEWSVTIDPTWGAHDRAQKAEDVGGYALTHVAEVRRRTGEAFLSRDLLDLNEAMSFLGFFAHGRRWGSTLPVGFDASGRAIWSQWAVTRVEGAVGAWSWLDRAHPEQLAELFPGFMARWRDQYWRGVLRPAIGYYADHTNASSDIALSVALAQVILEMLAYAWLVVETKLKTAKAFKSAGAASNLREMLHDMGIPVDIPDRLSGLIGWRTTSPALDAPRAIIRVRDAMIHMRPQQTQKPVDYQARIDTWKLAAWLVELAILRICGYGGLYRDRIRGEAWVGVVDPVPWA